jgi:hypothetical protein
LGCHLLPSSTMTTTSCNHIIHGIIHQASNSMATLSGLYFLDRKIWTSSLVCHFNGPMRGIHCSHHLLYFLQKHL